MTVTTIDAFGSRMASRPAVEARGGAARPRPTRLRITARGRAVLAGLIVIPAIAITVSAASVSAASVSDSTSAPPGASAIPTFDYVTVEAGESLWTIAERLAPDADPRDVVTEIATLNGIEGASVSAGQSLAVPLRYAD